jgi:hypothetical protein
MPDIQGVTFVVSGISERIEKCFPDSTASVKLRSPKIPYHTYSQFNEFIFGIPLTEDWLIKAGFEKDWENDEEQYYSKDGFDQLADYGGQSIVLRKEGSPYFNCGYYNNEIHFEFVHQLQNLYFALTGEELQFKL